MEAYARRKLSAKINLILSQGKKSEGAVSEKAIDDLMRGYDGDGTYEIVWERQLFPTEMKKLDDRCEVARRGKNYVVTFEGRYDRVLFWSQLIRFEVQEYRNSILKELLKQKTTNHI